MVQYVYGIKNKDGLYSSGLTEIKWSEQGKFWKNLRYLRQHLKLINDKFPKDSPSYPYRNVSIVRFKVEEVETLEEIK